MRYLVAILAAFVLFSYTGVAMAIHWDPAVIAAVKRKTSDPEEQAVLLATNAVEAGGRAHAVGDHGTSFGAWQMHQGGRLTSSGLTPQQAQDPNQAVGPTLAEFRQYRNADPGVWAANAQRPANPAAYAARVRSYIGAARRALGASGMQVRASGAGQRATQLATGKPVGDPTTALLSAMVTRPRGATMTQALLGAELNQALAPTQAGPTAPVKAPTVHTTDFQGHRFRAEGAPYSGTHTLGNWQSDLAYDFMGNAGQPVSLPYGAKVVKISGQPGGPPRFAGYGVTVRVPGGELFLKHLGALGPGVAVGSTVAPGAEIGTLDPTVQGGPHVHLGATSRPLLERVRSLLGR